MMGTAGITTTAMSGCALPCVSPPKPERTSSSFMIEDILREKNSQPACLLHSEQPSAPEHRSDVKNDSDPKKTQDFPQTSAKEKRDHHLPSQSQHFIPSSQSSFKPLPKPTPVLVSPLCTGFSRFALCSPLPVSISSPTYSNQVFTFPTSFPTSPLDSTILYVRNEPCAPQSHPLHPSASHPRNHIELGSHVESAPPSSLVQPSVIAYRCGRQGEENYIPPDRMTNQNRDSSLSRSLIWNHVIQRTQPKRKGGQIRFSSDQTAKLEKTFETQKYLSPTERKKLASLLRLTERQVKTWFQNRRAKWRRLKQERHEHKSQSNSPSPDVNNESDSAFNGS